MQRGERTRTEAIGTKKNAWEDNGTESQKGREWEGGKEIGREVERKRGTDVEE